MRNCEEILRVPAEPDRLLAVVTEDACLGMRVFTERSFGDKRTTRVGTECWDVGVSSRT